MKNLITFCFVCLLSAGIAFAQEWPQYNGPDQFMPVVKGDWLKSFPKQEVWAANVGTGFSSLVIADGRVFTMGNKNDTDYVYCLDEKSGKEIWQQSYPCKLNPRLYKGGPNTTPTVVGKHVYTLSREGHVFCFEAKTGKIVWKRNVGQKEGNKIPGFGFSGSPLHVDGKIILNVGSAGLALDAKSGETLWKSGTTMAGYATPVMFDKDTVLIFAEKALIAVQLADGKQEWSFSWPTKYGINSPQPIVKGNKVFIASGYGMGCALIDVSSGSPQQIWKNKTLEAQMCGPVLIDGYLYGVCAYRSKPGELRCVDFNTGEQVWAHEGFGHGAVIAVGNTLVIQAEKDGQLVLAEANPKSYVEIGRKAVLSDVCWTQPAVANKRVYVRNSAGDVLCLSK